MLLLLLLRRRLLVLVLLLLLLLLLRGMCGLLARRRGTAGVGGHRGGRGPIVARRRDSRRPG